MRKSFRIATASRKGGTGKTSLVGCFAAVCINKYDINEFITRDIEKTCKEQKIKILGRIAYDEVFVKAQVTGGTVMEVSNGKIKENIAAVWNEMLNSAN